MALIHRKSGYRIFISDIDAEHRTLFRLMDELEAALDSRTGEARGQIVEALISHLQDHFAHEERLMQASRYNLFAWHKKQHNGARRRVKELARRIEEGDQEAGPELLQHMAHWLQGHVLVTDRMMAAYLRNFGRRRAA